MRVPRAHFLYCHTRQTSQLLVVAGVAVAVWRTLDTVDRFQKMGLALQGEESQGCKAQYTINSYLSARLSSRCQGALGLKVPFCKSSADGGIASGESVSRSKHRIPGDRRATAAINGAVFLRRHPTAEQANRSFSSDDCQQGPA